MEAQTEEEKLHSLVASSVSPVDGAVDHCHGREHRRIYFKSKLKQQQHHHQQRQQQQQKHQ